MFVRIISRNGADVEPNHSALSVIHVYLVGRPIPFPPPDPPRTSPLSAAVCRTSCTRRSSPLGTLWSSSTAAAAAAAATRMTTTSLPSLYQYVVSVLAFRVVSCRKRQPSRSPPASPQSTPAKSSVPPSRQFLQLI